MGGINFNFIEEKILSNPEFSKDLYVTHSGDFYTVKDTYKLKKTLKKNRFDIEAVNLYRYLESKGISLSLDDCCNAIAKIHWFVDCEHFKVVKDKIMEGDHE